jgi:hypothetical protein
MSLAQIKRIMFEETSASNDWSFSYVIVPSIAGWVPEEDEVILALSPESVTWDDYGIRTRSFPPADSWSNAPWFQASSRDSSGIVTLLDPSAVRLYVPWNVLRQVGPGTINVGLQYRNDAGQRIHLLSGRLPLYDTVI